MSKAVHFRGINNIVESFISKGIPFFVVADGKNHLHKNESDDDIESAAAELQSFLIKLNQASNAVYTLKIYEVIPKGGIKENTPADYSLNFRLNLESMLPAPDQLGSIQSRNENHNQLMNAIAALNARIDAMESDDDLDDDDLDDQPQGITGAIGSMLAKPEVQTMLLNGFMNLFSNLSQKKPQAMAGVNDDQLQTALSILSECDDQLADDLMKLAKIAKSNPAQFQMLLSMLRSM